MSQRAVRGLRRFAFLLQALLAMALVRDVAAQTFDEQTSLGELTALSIEQLMQIEVTSVSKRNEKIADAPAAIFVVTQDDMRRMGATSVPEALRFVPGLQVARVDVNRWSISARGFNDTFANKLLVLMDGRTIYTPLFSGVFWDMQDTAIEDIDRIEVIRGPGATLWGANAVNGVINIITKSSKDTQGGLLSAAVGNEQRGVVTARYGGHIGADTTYRVYGKFYDRENVSDNAGSSEHVDQGQAKRGGFRLDTRLNAQDTLTLQGDAYTGYSEGPMTGVPQLTPPYTLLLPNRQTIDGANVLTRWSRTLSPESSLSVQAFFNREERGLVSVNQAQLVDTFDLDAQHSFAYGTRQHIVWGGGYRLVRSAVGDSPYFRFRSPERTYQLFSVFAQDEIDLVPERWRLTLGSKFEHNDFTGLVVEPSIRLLWTPAANHTLWGAISRAVRTPSIAESNVTAAVAAMANPLNPLLPPILTELRPAKAVNEDVLAFELGYRFHPGNALSLDLAAFYNQYDSLSARKVGAPVPEFTATPPRILVPIGTVPALDAETYGFEITADWHPAAWWRLVGAYAYYAITTQIKPGFSGLAGNGYNENDPAHQFYLHSALDLRKDLQLDAFVRYVSDIPARAIDGYVTLDARLAWRPSKALELALIGHNLADDEHLEFDSNLLSPAAPIARSFLATMRWSF